MQNRRVVCVASIVLILSVLYLYSEHNGDENKSTPFELGTNMPDNVITCTYDGLDLISASYTMTPGATPGRAEVEIAGSVVPVSGDLVFAVDGVTVFAAQDCRLDKSSFITNTATNTTKFSLRDLRWRWADLGEITGEYNKQDASGIIIDDAAKEHAGILAIFLTDAMGITNLIDTGLPTNKYPYVKWDSSAPAKALKDLCDRYHCIILIGWDYGEEENTIEIYRPENFEAQDIAVFGVNDPLLLLNAYTQSENVKDRPKEYVVIGAPQLHQVEVKLEASYFDPGDKLWKPIDEGTDSPSWFSGTDEWHDPKGMAKKLLEDGSADLSEAVGRTGFRCYTPAEDINLIWSRPDEETPGTRLYESSDIPSYWTTDITDREITYDGTQRASAYSKGVYFDPDKGALDESNGTDDRLDVNFSLKTPPGVTWFTRPVYDVDGTAWVGADLTLVCGLNGPVSTYKYVDNAGIDGQVRRIYRNDFRREFTGPNGAQTTVNYIAMLEKGQEYVDEERRKYVSGTDEISDLNERYDFAGLVYPLLTGGIESVAWTCGVNEAPRTIVARGRDSTLLNLETQSAMETLGSLRSRDRAERWSDIQETKIDETP